MPGTSKEGLRKDRLFWGQRKQIKQKRHQTWCCCHQPSSSNTNRTIHPRIKQTALKGKPLTIQTCLGKPGNPPKSNPGWWRDATRRRDELRILRARRSSGSARRLARENNSLTRVSNPRHGARISKSPHAAHNLQTEVCWNDTAGHAPPSFLFASDKIYSVLSISCMRSIVIEPLHGASWLVGVLTLPAFKSWMAPRRASLFSPGQSHATTSATIHPLVKFAERKYDSHHAIFGAAWHLRLQVTWLVTWHAAFVTSQAHVKEQSPAFPATWTWDEKALKRFGTKTWQREEILEEKY